MKALVVYSHPRPESFNHAIKELVVGRLVKAGVETRVIDLYAEGFEPRMSASDLESYEDPNNNRATIERHTADLEWCDTLIFVYPTWWYGLPAMLKGWLDRVMVPGLAFHMPDGGDIRPGLTNITRLMVFTTCGASWWLTRMIGAPGRRTILRGLRLICAKGCKTTFAAHYRMDSSTEASRAAHMGRVARKLDRVLKGST